MTLTNPITTTPINKKKLTICLILGYLIGLGIISSFVFTVNTPDPAWGQNWWMRPLVITPLATACGSLAFFLVDFVKPQNIFGKIICYLLSSFAFVISLWLGIVLGLDGTLWN